MRTYKVTRGHIITNRGPHTMLTQQWRYLQLARNSIYNLFPAKSIVSYSRIISIRLYVRLKGTCSLVDRALLNTGE